VKDITAEYAASILLLSVATRYHICLFQNQT